MKEHQVSVDTVRNQVLQCAYTWRTSVPSPHELMERKMKFMWTFKYEMWISNQKKRRQLWC